MDVTLKPTQNLNQVLLQKELYWYVLYTRSRCEKKVKERLEKLHIESFLPLIKVVRQWSDRKKQIQIPLFNGYLFLFTEPTCFSKIKMIDGAVDFIKCDKKPAVLKAEQIETIKKFIETGIHMEVLPDQYEPGEKVKIIFGPLKNCIGELIEIRNEKQFVLRIESIAQILKVSISNHHLEKL